jgi:RHS repeat-associated protein
MPVGWVKTQTHADTGVYHFAYTVVNGKSTQTDVTDPRGYVRRVTFNADGYTLADTRALGQPEARTTTSNRPSTNNFIGTSTDGLGLQTATTYDAMGNVLSVTRCVAGPPPCTETTAGALTTHYTYEPKFNQVATVTDPLQHTTTYGYDDAGNLTTVTDPLQHTTTFGYNAHGQRTSVTDALQHTTTFGYSGPDLTAITDPLNRVTTWFTDAIGRVLTITDPLGQITRYAYDRNGRLTTITDALGAETTFAYFPDGQVQAVTDANEHVTAFTYDAMGRLAGRTDPLQRLETFTYDLNGNPQAWTDRKGQVTSRAYDALNRLHQITYADSSTITYTYDYRDRVTQVDDSVPSASITRTYDDLDRLMSETTVQGSISYTYDDASRRTTMTVVGQPTVAYAYDDADRLTGLTRDSLSVGIGYDDANRRTTLTLPNGVVTEYGYDDADQLTSLTYRTGAMTLGDLSYAYDAGGRRVRVGGTWARTGVPQPVSSISYDAGNRLANWGGTPLTYDDAGNLTSDGLTSFAWDARNQLAGLTGTASQTFTYDAFGRRRSKSADAGVTQFTYDGIQLIQSSSPDGVSAKVIGLDLDEQFVSVDAQGTRVFLQDGLGSTLGTVAQGALDSTFTYEPYGATRRSGAPPRDATQFTGRENDENGLYFLRARYYSPGLSRFISEDPLGLDAGTNLYRYAAASPPNLVDPLGLLQWSIAKRFRLHVDPAVWPCLNAPGCSSGRLDVDCRCECDVNGQWHLSMGVRSGPVDVYIRTGADIAPTRIEAHELGHVAQALAIIEAERSKAEALEGKTYPSRDTCMFACTKWRDNTLRLMKERGMWHNILDLFFYF